MSCGNGNGQSRRNVVHTFSSGIRNELKISIMTTQDVLFGQNWIGDLVHNHRRYPNGGDSRFLTVNEICERYPEDVVSWTQAWSETPQGYRTWEGRHAAFMDIEYHRPRLATLIR